MWRISNLVAHRIINSAAKEFMQKISRPIPEEARPAYLTGEHIAVLKEIGFTQLIHPVVQKALRVRSEGSSSPHAALAGLSARSGLD
jgi:hypothetical protein